MSDRNSQDKKDFELALAEQLAREELSVGELVKGTIAAIHGDVALVDVGGKSEAVLQRSELDDLGVGDPVEVVVVETGDQVRVSRRLALERALKEELGRAAAEGMPVEGKVVGRRKGGFDVTVAGIRGFCPVSQIQEGRVGDPDVHLGKTYRFKVLEFDPEKKRLVVSRAVLLREERERAREELWSRLELDAEVEGTVRSITNFGAFVDLGGDDGLVHVTEISWRHLRHPGEVLSVGETVRAKVIELDRERHRIGLSIKQLERDPWEGIEERFPVRSRVTGNVLRKAPFGAFVEVTPGVEGLLHSSQLPPGMGLDELQAEQEVVCWVREVDAEQRRLSLTMRPLPEKDPWERIEMHYQPGQVVEGVVENTASFGVFVELEPGLSALVPASELGLPKGTEPGSAYSPGQRVKAKVLSLDPERRRMSLSVRAYRRDREREEYAQHMSKGPSSAPTATAFGQKLLEALKGSE